MVFFGIEEAMRDDAFTVDQIHRRIWNAGFEGDFRRIEDAVTINDFMISVLQERIIHLAGMIVNLISQIPRFVVRVQADGQNLILFLLFLTEQRFQLPELILASRSEMAPVKNQDDILFALVIREADEVAVDVFEREIGRGFAFPDSFEISNARIN
jgi:hypothetical protein